MKNRLLDKMSKKGWTVLETGRGTPIAFKNLVSKDGLIRCTAVSDDSIIIFKRPYDRRWSFFESGGTSIPNKNRRELAKYFNEKNVKELIKIAGMTKRFANWLKQNEHLFVKLRPE